MEASLLGKALTIVFNSNIIGLDSEKASYQIKSWALQVLTNFIVGPQNVLFKVKS